MKKRVILFIAAFVVVAGLTGAEGGCGSPRNTQGVRPGAFCDLHNHYGFYSGQKYYCKQGSKASDSEWRWRR